MIITLGNYFGLYLRLISSACIMLGFLVEGHIYSQHGSMDISVFHCAFSFLGHEPYYIHVYVVLILANCTFTIVLFMKSMHACEVTQGWVTPIGAIFRVATTVKMQSNGQGTFWGLIKRSSGVPGPTSSIAWQPRGVANSLCMQRVC